MAIFYDVDVYYKEISDLFRSSGPGGRWIDEVVLAMFRLAVATAPNRSGELAGSHRIFRQGVNQYKATISIEVYAEHAEYVHEGRPAGKKRGKGFYYLPPGGPGRNTVSPWAGQSFGAKKIKRIARQEANPWLDNACQEIAGHHGAY